MQTLYPFALTPAMQSVVNRIARAGHPPLHTLSPRQARAAYAAGAEVLEVPRAPLARVEEFRIAARDGHPLPARLYAAGQDTSPLPALLYLHGGGFTIGGIGTHDVLCRELARLSGCAVVSLDYRLAPEHRFPTAHDDAWDALAWLHGQGGARGLDTARLAVGGDSAGGTLAAACALQARDAGLPLALQMLFYPGCAPRQDTASHLRFADDPLIDATQIDWFSHNYLRSDADRDDWRFAPLLAPDVDGVAPAWFGLAECDPLVDEGLAYADRLRAAGVPVDLELWHGVTHEFIKMGRAIPEARQAHAAAAAALRQALDTEVPA
ncbi:alpha/beta hydrolase [Xylophilus ampelinus]|uniref:Acetyl esterase n=1 Tax=Xylophilus ampelinus TaxID=54067 RepID=A0A318SVK5_9BURK|nr:alpha/beta hydrolase [Xylophilus ampelinus]MCS4509715.1 alpha/beta hydrolase [Xylophilus ampelinus]PYE78757.1 acetyl esterase [Xylophilus ampelinus]